MKIGDSIKITMEDLQAHARSVPNHTGYTPAQFRYREILSDLMETNAEGIIESINGNEMTVRFGVSHLVNMLVRK